jgi:hypothetical protein
MDGIPDDVRSDARTMRDIMANTRKTPQQKLKMIETFAKTLFNQKVFDDWGIEIAPSPMQLDAKLLPLPQI